MKPYERLIEISSLESGTPEELLMNVESKLTVIDKTIVLELNEKSDKSLNMNIADNKNISLEIT